MANRRLGPVQERLRAAAVEYVAHGWGVLPGPTCDGLTYTAGHAPRPVPGLVSVLPSARTLHDAHAVWSWWSIASYAILALAGETFAVLRAPTAVAIEASGRTEFPHGGCPVATASDGARFLVAPGATLWPELAGLRGVELMPPGSALALPPSRVLAGSVTWWINPLETGWRLGDADAVQAALTAALTFPSSLGRR